MTATKRDVCPTCGWNFRARSTYPSWARCGDPCHHTGEPATPTVTSSNTGDVNGTATTGSGPCFLGSTPTITDDAGEKFRADPPDACHGCANAFRY